MDRYVLGKEEYAERLNNPQLVRNLDTVLGYIIHRDLEKKTYYCNPSCCQHISEDSSIGGRPATGKRAATEAAKERWDNIPADKKREMQEKAGRALRMAAVEGSKQEKFLKEKLQEMGIEVVMHKKGLIQGNFEIDLLLPELNTIIEVDGPQHFLPVFGEDKLAEVIKMDSIKNGLLIAKGYCVIRVKYLSKHSSRMQFMYVLIL